MTKIKVEPIKPPHTAVDVGSQVSSLYPYDRNGLAILTLISRTVLYIYIGYTYKISQSSPETDNRSLIRFSGHLRVPDQDRIDGRV